MQNLQGKIKKLLFAVNLKGNGIKYLFSRKQFYSEKKKKTFTVKVLSIVMTVENWNTIFPQWRKDRRRYKRTTVQKEIFSSFKDVDILLLLADILKKGNETAFELVDGS